MSTSRARLDLPGEHLLPVAGLAYPPETLSPTDPREGHFPAIELFVKAAQCIKPGYALLGGDAATVAAICRRVEGAPLALLLHDDGRWDVRAFGVRQRDRDGDDAHGHLPPLAIRAAGLTP